LNQISPVLLVDMFRHVETLGRTIKVEVAFRCHIPPFWYLWPYPKTGLRFARRRLPGSQVQRALAEPIGGKAMPGQKHRQLVDPSLEYEILGRIA
jgi:hypothetical protein